MSKGYTTRQHDIDFLKTVAILGVVSIHTSRAGLYYPVGSFTWMASLFWGAVTRGSVPIFFMCSGALMLPPEKELPLRKLYTHNLARLVMAMLVWALFYKVLRLWLYDTVTLNGVWQAIKEVVLFKQEFHFYYLHIIFLVYACLPITRLLVKTADRRQLEYLLLVWFVLSILYPTLRPFWPWRLLTGIPTQWMINLAYGAIGYGILGYYLKKYPLPVWSGWCMAIVGFLLTFLGTYVLSARIQQLDTSMLEGTAVGPALLAAGIVTCVVQHRKEPGRTMRFATDWISRASFCIYLVHVAVIYLLMEWGITIAFAPAFISVPLLVALNIILCMAVYLLLRQIPLVRRWII